MCHYLTQFHSNSEKRTQRIAPRSPPFKNVPCPGPPLSPQCFPSSLPPRKCRTNGFRGRRGSAGCPRAPENKGDSQPLSSAALSITSTSKAVACAVISTAGNVTTRPTAQTTTSARAMVSGGTAPAGASEASPARLRPSSAADVGWAPLPFPAPAGDPAQRRAARPPGARPESSRDRRRRRRSARAGRGFSA